MSDAQDNTAVQSLLNSADVAWSPLTELQRQDVEKLWRAVYGNAFSGRPRLRQGSKADYEYAQQPACRWYVFSLSANVSGTAVSVYRSSNVGYECAGKPVPMGEVCSIELAISPADFSWTMLYTHEDHAFGGPYFIRQEWIP